MTEQYYKFIRPTQVEPREPIIATTRSDVLDSIQDIIHSTPSYVFYDLETTGLVYSDPQQMITTVGLASPDWVYGLNLVELTTEECQPLWDWLGQQKLGGFNLGFDLSWPWRTDMGDGRVNPNIDQLSVFSDTALWFRLLATEGHELQMYNLETAIEKILCWPERYLQKSWLKSAFEKHSIKKSEMWKFSLLEPVDYTRYCAMDAEASMQLHDVFQDTLRHWSFQGLNKYHDNILVPKIKRQIKATCNGVPVDRDLLARNTEIVRRKMATLEAQALEHPEMKPYVDEFTQNKLDKQHNLNYSLKKVWAKKADEPWLRPDIWRLQHVEDASKLPSWTKEFGGKFYKPETKFSITGSSKEWPRFNVGSTVDMKWLIYDKLLGGDYDVWYRDPYRPKRGGLVTVKVNGQQYTVELTKSGGLPTGGDILTVFGELGQLINEYKTLAKLNGDFLTKFEMASGRTNFIHPQSKILGTITGRASGGSG